MSILVEALSVVVRRLTLDICYPGGTEAYLAAAARPGSNARFAIADERLTCVSFLQPDDLVAWVLPLAEHGLVGADADEVVDVATVDQRFGPSMPCGWLAVERGTDGVTRAWLDGAVRGALVVPEGWAPAVSRRLLRTDDGDAPGRLLRLGVEETEHGTMESWLDFTTGRVTTRLPQRVPLPAADPPDPFPPDLSMLFDVARAALDERGFQYELVPDDTRLRFRVTGRSADYYAAIRTDEEWEQAMVLVGSAQRIPEHARARACELFTRVNFGLRIGCFELDMDDGEWRFRVSVDVEGGELTPRMVNLMLSAALSAMDDHHDAVMRVAFADLGAVQAYDEAQAARYARMDAASSNDAAFDESRSDESTSDGSTSDGSTSDRSPRDDPEPRVPPGQEEA